MGQKCGAKLRSGGRCGQAAGHRTDHPGTGACWLHGGCSVFPSGPANPNYKHGLYSKYRSPEEVAEFEVWRAGSGTQHDQLSADDEFLLFRLERRIAQSGAGEKPLTTLEEAELLERITKIRLNAQKLRGGEKPAEVNVNLNAREDLLVRLAGIAARRRAGGGAGGTE